MYISKEAVKFSTLKTNVKKSLNAFPCFHLLKYSQIKGKWHLRLSKQKNAWFG